VDGSCGQPGDAFWPVPGGAEESFRARCRIRPGGSTFVSHAWGFRGRCATAGRRRGDLVGDGERPELLGGIGLEVDVGMEPAGSAPVGAQDFCGVVVGGDAEELASVAQRWPRRPRHDMSPHPGRNGLHPLETMAVGTDNLKCQIKIDQVKASEPQARGEPRGRPRRRVAHHGRGWTPSRVAALVPGAVLEAGAAVRTLVARPVTTVHRVQRRRRRSGAEVSSVDRDADLSRARHLRPTSSARERTTPCIPPLKPASWAS
jgi:hypothetical protein